MGTPSQENSAAITTLKQPEYLFKKNISTEVQTASLNLSAVKPIATKEAREAADNFVKSATKTRNKVAEIRLAVTKTMNEVISTYIAQERAFASQLDGELVRVKNLISAYDNEQLRLLRLAQQKIKDDAEKEARRKRSEQGLAAVAVKEQAQLQSLPKLQGVAIKYVLSGVSDMAKVPAEFLSVDTDKVKEAIKNGRTEIPGLIITEIAGRTGR